MKLKLFHTSRTHSAPLLDTAIFNVIGKDGKPTNEQVSITAPRGLIVVPELAEGESHVITVDKQIEM